MHGSRPFTLQDTENVYGQSLGLAKEGPTEDEQKVLKRLRGFYLKPQQDLAALLAHFRLDEHMHGLNMFLHEKRPAAASGA